MLVWAKMVEKASFRIFWTSQILFPETSDFLLFVWKHDLAMVNAVVGFFGKPPYRMEYRIVYSCDRVVETSITQHPNIKRYSSFHTADQSHSCPRTRVCSIPFQCFCHAEGSNSEKARCVWFIQFSSIILDDGTCL